jgi:hypothetical protein
MLRIGRHDQVMPDLLLDGGAVVLTQVVVAVFAAMAWVGARAF